MKRKSDTDDLDPTVDALVHPGAPSGGIGPGWSETPAPLGLDFQFNLDPDSPDSPSSLLADGSRPRRKKASKTGFLRGLFAPPRRANDRNRKQEKTAEADSEKNAEPASPGRRLPSLQTIRERLGPEGLQAIQQMVKDPSLAMSTLQGDLLGKIGRFANMGDKSAVRRGVFELVEKLDVTAPKDSVVLVAREKGGSLASGNLSRELGRLGEGKRALEMTQGGRVITQLQPVLAQNKAFAWTDGLDRGWQRLNERFAQQAQGTVDVIVGAHPATAAMPPGAVGGVGSPIVDAPVGSWDAGAAGAPPASGPGPVGSWSAPDPSAQAPVGQWATPGQAPPGAAADPSARVGSWAMPSEVAKGDAPIGQWGAPADAPAASKAASVGAWQMPAADGGAGAVGTWNTPGAAGAAPPAGADAPIGSWQAPPADPSGAGGAGPARVGQWQAPPPDAAGAGGATTAPVGQWQTPAGGSAQGPQVGQWAAPAGPGAAPPGAAGAGGTSAPVGSWSAGASGNAAAAPGNSPAGVWTQPQDIQVGDGLQLAEILRQNPQLSDVRIVELIQSADRTQPPKLQTVATLARSLFGERFGFK